MMRVNTKTVVTRARAVAVLGAFVLAVALGACAGNNSASRSGSTVPKVGAKDDVVGGGGQMDEIYRQIYTPDRGTYSVD